MASAIFHPMANIVATTSGQRHYDLDDSSDEETDSVSQKVQKVDNSLKIWSMPLPRSESDVQ